VAGAQVRFDVPSHVRRPIADDLIRVAGLVRPGEWASYGDLSAAVLGHTRWARQVGTLAATDERFPNAHRILTSDGRVSRPGSNTRTARQKLEAEGVRFSRGRADRQRRVHWDELQRRDGRIARSTG
jgi:alkylated DNA nucleotide flippase Atl1